MKKTAVFITENSDLIELDKIAQEFNLPLVMKTKGYDFFLAFHENRLTLQTTKEKIKPIYVDFLSEEAQRRLKRSRGRSELIARAVGIKGNFLPTIIDTTAGLGGDAIILAHLGCDVIALERSPIIYALLRDGLKRAGDKLPALIAHLKLRFADARKFLEENSQVSPDVIYLDPMFPERVKSALVKKEMRVLKEIVGEDLDAEELFLIAMQRAKKRVVVKRPRLAPTLTNEKPSIVYSGKVCRFDVYL